MRIQTAPTIYQTADIEYNVIWFAHSPTELMTYVAGAFRTLRAYAPRSTSRAHGSAVTSSIPGATWPAYFSARVAAVSGAFHQHWALAARKFCKMEIDVIEKCVSIRVG